MNTVQATNPLKCVASMLLMACAISLPITAAQAVDYTFAPEPTYPAETARDLYKPLLDYLSEATGQTFVLVSAANYSSYWRDIKKTPHPDFSFDEAHFADYRIQHLDYTPLVRTREPTRYTLLSSMSVESLDTDQLFGDGIASMPAPSLGYALLMEFFPNPVHQPKIVSASSWRDAIQSVFSGDAGAAVAPSSLMDTYPNLNAIRVSREFPGPAFLAASTVPEAVRIQVRDALLKMNTDPALTEKLLELGISTLIPASASDYEGSQEVLNGFYGY